MSEQTAAPPPSSEALADRLTACADALHARLEGDAAAGLTLDEADALQDAEQALRERAGGLYLDAAASLVAHLGDAEQQVLSLTAAATERIRRIARVAGCLSLAGDLLSLVGAAATGPDLAIATALESIKHHLDTAEADHNDATLLTYSVRPPRHP